MTEDEKINHALNACRQILREVDAQFVIFICNEEGFNVASNFCCKRHMALTVVECLNDMDIAGETDEPMETMQ